MTYQEKVSALKDKLQAKIKSESTPEEIAEVNSLLEEIDGLASEFETLSQEHAKTKDSLVRMVVNQGNSDKPKEELEGSKPRSFEEIIADELKKEGK